MARERQRTPNTSLNAVDSHSLYLAQQAANATRHDYGYLATKVLPEVRHQFGMSKAQVTIASVTRDPHSERQGSFIESLRRTGMVVDEINFWWAWVEQIGQRPEPRERVASLAPTIAYLLGLAAGRAEALPDTKPEAVVVTGSFEICRSCLDFVDNRGGKLVIAFYKSFLDPRWTSEGLFEEGFPIGFYNLDPESEALMGVPSPQATGPGRGVRNGGLASF